MSAAHANNLDLMAPPVVKTIQKRSLVFGLIFAVISCVLAFLRPDEFFRAYLLGYMAWLGRDAWIHGDSHDPASHRRRVGHGDPPDSGRGHALLAPDGRSVCSNPVWTSETVRLGAASGFHRGQTSPRTFAGADQVLTLTSTDSSSAPRFTWRSGICCRSCSRSGQGNRTTLRRATTLRVSRR